MKLEMETETQFFFEISYFEIYNEQIKDLLDPSNKQIKIFEQGKGFLVKGLTTKYSSKPGGKWKFESFKEQDQYESTIITFSRLDLDQKF